LEFDVWGPYFFEEDDVTVTVTSDWYCTILENFLWPKLDDLFDGHGAENVWLQQDGAQPTLLFVYSEFSEKCCLGMLSPCVTAAFARFHPVPFFLWGYLKAQVCQHRPQTLEGLKEAITQEITAIPPEMTLRVMEKYWERHNQCVDNEGRH
jgi:hypothetical protein